MPADGARSGSCCYRLCASKALLQLPVGCLHETLVAQCVSAEGDVYDSYPTFNSDVVRADYWFRLACCCR